MRKLIALLFISLFLLALPLHAQGNGRLRIAKLDSTNFPEILLNAITVGSDGLPLNQLGGLNLLENGQPVQFDVIGRAEIGTDITFVIDAGRGIRIQDDFESTGSVETRLDKVKESITRFSDSFMGGSDQVSVMMPLDEGDWGDKSVGSPKFIVQNSRSSDEVRNAVINLGRLSTVEVTPLNSMLLRAVENAKQKSEGQYQAILLYTDARYLDQQIEFEQIVAEAQEANIAIFVAVLGDNVEQLEIDNARQLFGPTNGRYVPMPFAVGTDQLFSIFQAQSSQTQIRFRSRVNTSSEDIDVRAQLNGVESFISYDIDVDAPTVSLGVDVAQPIVRVIDGEDASLPQFQPNAQQVNVFVSWPDNHPRKLSEVELLINEVPQGGDKSPTYDEVGNLVLTADISRMRSGIYNLEVEITDELGLQATSPVFPLSIEIDLEGLSAEAVEAATAVLPTVTPEPVVEEVIEPTAEAVPTNTAQPTIEVIVEPEAVLPTAEPVVQPTEVAPIEPVAPVDTSIRGQFNRLLSQVNDLPQGQTVLLLGGAVVGLIIFVLLWSLLRLIFRRRESETPVVETPIVTPQTQETVPVPAVSEAQFTADQERVSELGNLIENEEETQNITPQFQSGSWSETDGAFLRVIANASEHSGGIIIQSSNVILGRDPIAAQVVLQDASVSRVHARIMQTNGVYRIYDEGSTSGTFLNFKRIGLTPHTLRDNDQIHIGRVHLQFRLLPANSSIVIE